MTQPQAGPTLPTASPSPSGPDLAFAATLAARLCHDLAGTMGALTGMLDMAAGGTEPEALDLALTCARELSARLRLLRAAWSDDAETPDLESVLAGLPGAERLRVELPEPAPDSGVARRLAANLLLMAAGALPRGGAIRMTAGQWGIAVDIDGPRAAWPAALARCLSDPEALTLACTTSREVGVAVACLVAAKAGWRLTVHSQTRLTAGP